MRTHRSSIVSGLYGSFILDAAFLDSPSSHLRYPEKAPTIVAAHSGPLIIKMGIFK